MDSNQIEKEFFLTVEDSSFGNFAIKTVTTRQEVVYSTTPPETTGTLLPVKGLRVCLLGSYQVQTTRDHPES
ncbi:UNVERIFIED_CONTAM: hypothetical protein FKN15_005560 [Acipenser sinensis]